MGHLPGRLLGTPIAPKAILVSTRRLGTSSALTVNPISVARADRHWLIRSNSASGLLRGSYDGFWFSGGPFGCVLAPWGSVSDIMLRPTRNPYSHSSPSALAIPIRQCRDHHIDAWAGRVSDAELTPKMKKPRKERIRNEASSAFTGESRWPGLMATNV